VLFSAIFRRAFLNLARLGEDVSYTKIEGFVVALEEDVDSPPFDG
jgi:hypothetical protein